MLDPEIMRHTYLNSVIPIGGKMPWQFLNVESIYFEIDSSSVDAFEKLQHDSAEVYEQLAVGIL